MKTEDRTWLENRLHAAVDDDFYLDRDEEKRIKEEGTSRGLGIRDIELTIQTELKKTGSVSERLLLDEFERMLRQFTDDDKLLDRKEERDAFDHVVRPAEGKRKGLDPQVAEAYVASFCRVNGIRRSTNGGTRPGLLIGAGVLAAVVLALIVILSVRGGDQHAAAGRSAQNLSDADRARIDEDLHRAGQYIEQAQYTDPPERSAKAELDDIAQIDPGAGYRSTEVNAVKSQIVDHYLTLAERNASHHDKAGATRWLDRARLLNADKEGIDEKARALGLPIR